MKKVQLIEEPIPPPETKPDFDWWVFSTCVGTVELMLRCAKTDAFAVVPDPTKEEWKRAHYAPNNPYHWPKDDYGRVVVKSLARAGGTHKKFGSHD